MIETGASYLVQADGESPTTLVAGSAPGESGVSVVGLRFRGGLHFSATPHQHLIWFASPVRFDCRIAGRTLAHEAPAGSLAICPAGSDCGADAEESVNALLVAIDPGRFALAAAEDSALEAHLNERLSGYDQVLLDLARTLALESAEGYPNGPFTGGRLPAASSAVWLLVILQNSRAGDEGRWARRCSSGSETMSLPTSMSRSRLLCCQI